MSELKQSAGILSYNKLASPVEWKFKSNEKVKGKIMEVPSEEFWYKMGLCVGSVGRLREIKRGNGSCSDCLQEEEIKLIDFLWETLTEVGKAVYED